MTTGSTLQNKMNGYIITNEVCEGEEMTYVYEKIEDLIGAVIEDLDAVEEYPEYLAKENAIKHGAYT